MALPISIFTVLIEKGHLRMKLLLIIGIAVLTAAFATTANAAYLHYGEEISEVTGDDSWGFAQPVLAFDESGLGGTGGELHTGGEAGTEWVARLTGTSHWVRAEFDKGYPLGEMWVWNSQWAATGTIGFRSTDVYYQAEDGGPDILLGNYEFAKIINQADEHYQTVVDFGGIVAHSVRLQQLTDWGHPWGAGGLAEVRFNLIPEPGSLALLAGGALLLLSRRRRKA